jgi:hypothetical protein
MARAGSGEKWSNIIGTIKRVLLTTDGNVDGVLLTDNTAVRFSPVPTSQIPQIQSGVQLKTAGPSVANQLRTGIIVVTSQDQVVNLGPSTRTREMAGTAAPSAIPFQALVPLKDISQVDAILRGPRGEIDLIVLTDGATVRVPQQVKMIMPDNMKVGDRVVVNGVGAKYPLGTVIEARSIH